ncbi:hypothetical protein O3P69_003791 [Scylla paramamosain]|uniref:Uncharacterized protein n=1 Tax=Scylla paramamosain TaxID=85552 RepID=A0AAW0UDA4_SCYPA
MPPTNLEDQARDDQGIPCISSESTTWEDILRGAPPIQYSTLSGPSFLNASARTYEVVSGGTAKMHCGVRNLHNYTVRCKP